MQVLSATHEYFAAVSEDNRLKVWDVSSGAIEHDLKERDHLNYKYTCITWTQHSPLTKAGSKRAKTSSQGLIALGTSTGVIVIWDLRKGEVVQRLSSDKEGHNGAINDVAFNSQGNLLYSCSSDKNVLEWNVKDGSVARKFRCGSEGAQKVAVSPEDEILAVGGTAIRTFDLSSGKKARKLVAGLSSAVNQLRFSQCKRYLFSATIGGRFVNMYDLSNAENDEPVVNFSMPSSSASLFVRTKSAKKKADVLLGAVSTTGSLFVWNHKYKVSSAKTTKPVAPDAKSGATAGVLVAELGQDENEQSQITVVRGSTAKPAFEKLSLLDDQQQLVSELAFAPISEHLLLGDKESAQKKQKVLAEAAEKEKTHIPALAERSGLAKAKDVVDASGEFDELRDEDEDEEDGEGALSLAERVEALRERVENDLAAEMVRVDADATANRVGPSERPDASSLSSLLEQALQSKDNAMLEYCLRTRDAKVIANTIKRVSSVKVLELLDILVLKFEKSPGRCARLCPWIRSILLHHTAYLMTQPDLVQSLSALYQILENRLKVHDALQKLSGRLSLVIGQIHEASYQQQTGEGDAEGDAPRAKIVYKEDDETDQQEDEEDDDEEEEDDEDAVLENGVDDDDDDDDVDMDDDDEDEE
ncbi:hypothetical protein Poli38472_006338 [Pythium oligandrum]|uniref:Small-subunit processome Utp12 domain-containing protein n=1 Tax=Pythium oligandrum TaxID=41045 RepID=A0A8K1C4L7_PYTOL|nr:hypothetical protein Poli38472_006338 [Pythium oligandrum]|eukprot:TMW56328.1 hypothetical protein Poli38472_006338 [Pythium oligandrum]